MPDPIPRRPRFLASVPDHPVPPAIPFTPPAAGPAIGARPQPVVARPPQRAAPPPPPQPPAPAAAASPRAEASDARREALERVGGAIETLRAQAAHLAEQARADALEIGFLVARTILESEVRQSPQALFQLVRQAVRRAGDSRRIAIRLSPEDAATVTAEHGRAALFGPASARVEIVADPALERGDCVVDTDFGRVDGRLETRLGELRRALQGGGEPDEEVA